MRLQRKNHVRVLDVERDVSLVGLLVADCVGETLVVVEGVGENQPPPAAIDRRLAGELLSLYALRRIPVAQRGRAPALDPMPYLVGFHDARPST